tara:strand:+ start:80747 stop:80947 length:201 start_codon:yes stop_codon:yes gene_type:complete
LSGLRSRLSLGLLPTANDGAVSVEGGRQPELQDCLLVDELRVSIRGCAFFYEQVIRFLNNGLFKSG